MESFFNKITSLGLKVCLEKYLTAITFLRILQNILKQIISRRPPGDYAGKTNDIIGKTFLKLLIKRKVELWERTVINFPLREFLMFRKPSVYC